MKNKSFDFTVWSEVRNDIKLQMTSATYEATIAGSVAISATATTLTVRVSTLAAQAHLSRNGLGATIARAMERRGDNRHVEFVLDAAPELPAVEPARPTAADAPTERSVLAGFDLSAAKWSKHPRYVSLFWGPYLSARDRLLGIKALGVWQYLRDSRDIFNDCPAWSPPVTLTAKALSVGAGVGIRQLLGARRTCGIFDAAIADGSPVMGCLCGRGKLGTIASTGREVCRYKRPGILELLARGGLVYFERKGTRRSLTFRLQVRVFPSLLTPAQATMCGDAVYMAHIDFLRRDLGVEVTAWEAVTVTAFWELDGDVSGLEPSVELAPLSPNGLKDFFLNPFGIHLESMTSQVDGVATR